MILEKNEIFIYFYNTKKISLVKCKKKCCLIKVIYDKLFKVYQIKCPYVFNSLCIFQLSNQDCFYHKFCFLSL